MEITAESLRAIERGYGAVQRGVPRRRVSRLDPRSERAIKIGGMQGNDRMCLHSYDDAYAEFLPAKLQPGSTIVELGILRGHGLALLCDLYPACSVIGLDVDLSHYYEAVADLRRRGAFAASGDPRVYEFDELSSLSWASLGPILALHSVSIWIDDALHDDESVISTALRARTFMAPGSVYFIEDNDRVAARLSRYLPASQVYSRGRLTVIRRSRS